MDKKILLIGGGGHCRSVIDVIESMGEYTIVGIIDRKENIGQEILGYKIIGCDDELETFKDIAPYACVTIGSKGDSLLRKKIFNKLLKLSYKLPNIIASSAYVSKHIKIGRGNVIMHHAFINSNVVINDNNVFNSKSLVEHDSIIDSHNYISTDATINGMVKIGENCYIGSSSVINQTKRIHDNIIIGSGAVVVNDCIEKGVYIGIPAKKR